MADGKHAPGQACVRSQTVASLSEVEALHATGRRCNHDNDVAKFKDFLNNLYYINPCPRRATIVNMIFMTSNLMHYN